MDNRLFISTLLTFVLLTTLSLAQNNFVHIHGRTYATVIYRNNDTVPVKNARVKLICKDTTLYQLTPDNGHFSFSIPKSQGTATLHVETGKSTSSKEKYQCIFISPSILNAFVFELSNNGDISHNIELSPNELPHCIPRFATFFFEKQSITSMTAIANDTLGIDSAFNQIYSVLRDLPKMKVRIEGHTDINEKEKLSLSAARAQYFFDKLIQLGISKERLIPMAYEDKKTFPFIEKSFAADDFIYTKDKKILAKRNQRTTFEIVSWGFD